MVFFLFPEKSGNPSCHLCAGSPKETFRPKTCFEWAGPNYCWSEPRRFQWCNCCDGHRHDPKKCIDLTNDSDSECECEQNMPTIEKILREFGDDVQIRFFPMTITGEYPFELPKHMCSDFASPLSPREKFSRYAGGHERQIRTMENLRTVCHILDDMQLRGREPGSARKYCPHWPFPCPLVIHEKP